MALVHPETRPMGLHRETSRLLYILADSRMKFEIRKRQSRQQRKRTTTLAILLKSGASVSRKRLTKSTKLCATHRRTRRNSRVTRASLSPTPLTYTSCLHTKAEPPRSSTPSPPTTTSTSKRTGRMRNCGPSTGRPSSSKSRFSNSYLHYQ